MAHDEQRRFFALVSEFLVVRSAQTSILEVGSLDINGSLREFAPGCRYVGIDMAPGPGVDLVCEGQDFDPGEDRFDVVWSAECMEHNPYWEATVKNMVRLLRPGGLFVLSCAAPGRAPHGLASQEAWASPLTVAAGWDYYRNLSFRDVYRSGALAGLSPVGHWTIRSHHDLYIVGRRDSTDDGGDWERFVAAADALVRTEDRGGWRAKSRATLRSARRVLGRVARRSGGR
jgi:SAM-dependent methyltransferase